MKDGMTKVEWQNERANLVKERNRIREELDGYLGDWSLSNGVRDNAILSLEAELKYAEADLDEHYETSWVGN